MHTFRDRDLVHELAEVPCPSSGSAEPLVLASEDTLVLAYVSAPPGSDQPVGAGTAPSTTTMVVFRQCYASHFGQPNDEAFSTHKADGGLRPYGAFELEHSSWLRGLEMRNRAHPHHDPERFQRLRHWVWTFHDSVLECAALSYTVTDSPGRPGEAIPRMQALLRSS